MDPVQTEIMKNRFSAIVEEGSTIVIRTAYTTFVKQTQDYQCALATAQGEIFAYPYMSGVTSFIGISLAATLKSIGIETLKDGDIIITNDPFRSEGMCSHTMDVHLIKPIFFDGQIIAHAWSFLHASDIGGAVPGSISPTLTEVFQEGIRLRPMKLYAEGALNKDVLNIFQDNCRIPEEVWGDLQALIAAMKTMERRLHALCVRLGLNVVTASMHDLISLAEIRARDALKRIPDGTYRFSDYLEGVLEDELTFINVAMIVKAGTVHLDFTGSDPQVPAALNFISGTAVHPFLTQALNYFVLTQHPNTPMNAGVTKPFTVVAPSGTIMNAEFPAAMGNRWVTAMRIYDCVIGCLNQAVKEGVVSCGAGQAGIIAVSGRDPRTGKRRVSVVNPLCGGSGGRRNGDGVDGVDGPQGYLQNTPIEVVELETPLYVRRYELNPDSYAAGEWRSGAGIVIELENTDVEAVITVRGMNRFRFRPWGSRGAAAGSLGKVILNPGTRSARSIGKITVLHLRKGDVVRMISPSGGGFGDPRRRRFDLIERDVRSGLLSRAKAEQDYCVAFVDGVVDPVRTRRKRAKQKSKRQLVPIEVGAERRAYEQSWPQDIRSFLASLVLRAPIELRPHLLRAVVSRVRATRTRGRLRRQDVSALMREEMQKMMA